MIRDFHLADWFTLANALCGTGALFSIMSYLQLGDVRHIYFACALLLAALLFDILGGRIARWRQQTSTLGGELDSLADELIGAQFKNYFTDPERAEAGIRLALSEKKVGDYELTARARDGKETVVSYNASTLYDRDRKRQGVFAAARDITERKQAAAQILQLAMHDSLTQLPNRRLLNERRLLTRNKPRASLHIEYRRRDVLQSRGRHRENHQAGGYGHVSSQRGRRQFDSFFQRLSNKKLCR